MLVHRSKTVKHNIKLQKAVIFIFYLFFFFCISYVKDRISRQLNNGDSLPEETTSICGLVSEERRYGQGNCKELFISL